MAMSDEERLAKKREFYRKNKAKILAQQKAQKDANRDLIREKGRDHYKANKEAIRNKQKLYKEKNMLAILMYDQLRSMVFQDVRSAKARHKYEKDNLIYKRSYERRAGYYKQYRQSEKYKQYRATNKDVFLAKRFFWRATGTTVGVPEDLVELKVKQLQLRRKLKDKGAL